MSDLREINLFSGIGGVALGLKRAGFRTVCYCEVNPFCQDRLIERMKDGTLDSAPLWSDVSDFDGRPWSGEAEILSAGWPCQGNSIAGKHGGLSDARSGLWRHVKRILGEVRPLVFLGENVPGLLSVNGGRDFLQVIQDLEELGYGVAWRVLDARYFGVPQRRRRVFIVGYLGAPPPVRVLFDGADSPMVQGGIAKEDVRASRFVSLPLRAESVKHGNLPVLIGACPDSHACPDSQGVRAFDGSTRRLDMARYRSLGNSVAVPVLEWIGKGVVEALRERRMIS